MLDLDFGNIYNSTGNIMQLRYAQKAINKGSTIIALRNSKGVVLFVSKPIISKLHVRESNHRIKKVASNVYMAYTGLLPSGFFVTSHIKRSADNYRSTYQSEITVNGIKEALGDLLYMFTQYDGLRIAGASFLTIMHDKNRYIILGADCAGKVTEYHGFAFGSGSQRAQTEIEKMDLESMEIKDLIDQGIRTLYKCYDPLSDSSFGIEVGMLTEDSDGEFIRIKQETVDEIAEKYKDISIDED